MIRNLIIFAILASLTGLQGCYIDKECLCTDIYAPVCGENGVTYVNSCAAECDDIKYIDGECPVYGIGQVTFSGDSLCGFLVKISGSMYSPDTLAPFFREDGLWVSLRYRRFNQYFTCEEPYGHYQSIQVLEIEKL